MAKLDFHTLEELEKIASSLEPNEQELQDWNHQMTAYGSEFILNIRNEPTFGPNYTSIQALEELEISDEPRQLSDLIPVLKTALDQPGVSPANPGHLGYIPGGGVYSSAIADYITAFTDHFAGMYFAGPGAVKMENDLIRWMCALVGYPSTAFGNLSSGGSIGNLTAIVTARDEKGINSSKVKQAVIYVTNQTHHCIHKALRIAGLGESVVREIPTDTAFKMNVDLLQEQIIKDKEADLIPFMIVGSIGTTDVGAVDPIDEIADVAQVNDCWFHIDAAYGGFFILVDQLKALFRGVERSDSIVMDPHKTLFLPYGSGAVLVKEGKALLKSNHYRANYLQDAGNNNPEISPSEASPELTKHFRGLRMWLPLQLHGLKPFKACLEEKHMLTHYFYEQVQEMGFEVGPTPELSVCIYKYNPKPGIDANDYNLRISHRIRERSKYFISTTTIDSVLWLRIAIANFRTHLSNINEYLAVLKEASSAVENQVQS